MTNNQILQELEALAERLCVPLDYEEGAMRGGLCRVAGQRRIIICRELSLSGKINILCQVLRWLPTENVFVLPQIRMLLETPERPEDISSPRGAKKDDTNNKEKWCHFF